VTPGPGHRKCTTYLWPGPGGAPLALPLTERLGLARRPFPSGPSFCSGHHGYGVPSLRTNLPSRLWLIKSMSEQVVRSSGWRDPTSR